MANASQAHETAKAGTKTEEESEMERLQKAIQQLQQVKAHLQKDKYANLTVDILSTLVDDLCTDVCVDVHRSLKMGLICIPSSKNEHSTKIVDVPGYDIHGLVPEKVPKSEHFNCDHCGTKVGAAKYAAHLAKCMGHGGRQRRARDTGADSGPNPYLSSSPSHPRPLPPSPPNAAASSANSVSPVGVPKRAASPSRPRAGSPSRQSPSKRAASPIKGSTSPGKAEGGTPSSKRARTESEDGMEEERLLQA